MAGNDNTLDKIAMGKCEVPHTKSQCSFCTIIILYIKQETPGTRAKFGPRAIVGTNLDEVHQVMLQTK